MNEITDGLPTIEEQRAEARQWAEWFREAGYQVLFSYTGEPEPFDREWQIWTDNQTRYTPIARIDIDGTGASWHGPDVLWREVIEPHVEMI